jgi:hypothetical protein
MDWPSSASEPLISCATRALRWHTGLPSLENLAQQEPAREQSLQTALVNHWLACTQEIN